MKKNIKKIGLLLFATLLFFSCNNDFLERYPLDKISNETFWNTENDLLAYNNNLYDLAGRDYNVPIMRGHEQGWTSAYVGIWYEDEMADNVTVTRAFRNQQRYIRAGKHQVPAKPKVTGYRGWDFVRACNIGIDNYNRADIAQSVIDKYTAEARLFRGWFYAEKVTKFGDVQWIEHELTTESKELYGERTPREEVMENVLADLNFACEKLPNDWGDGASPGRLDRWCALAVKARVCLFEGTWRKYHGGTNPNMWLQAAADAAKELIESGSFSLFTTGDPEHDYASYQRSPDLSGNPEIIYWIKYEAGIKESYAIHGQSFYGGGATKSFVEDYLCTDGLPISLSPLYQGDAQIEDIFINRDPRLRQTILHPDDQLFYQYLRRGVDLSYPRLIGMPGNVPTYTGYHVIKVYEIENAMNHNHEVIPAITLRFGETLLIYAEAKAELGTITQADLDMSINKLRDRVNMVHMDINNIPVDPKYVNDGVPPLIVEIRRERRIELFLEGFRYDDIRRWKQGKKLAQPDLGILWDDVAKERYPGAIDYSTLEPVSGKRYLEAYQGTDWANPVFDENKHYLWPIPLNALAQNPSIRQNPGW